MESNINPSPHGGLRGTGRLALLGLFSQMESFSPFPFCVQPLLLLTLPSSSVVTCSSSCFLLSLQQHVPEVPLSVGSFFLFCSYQQVIKPKESIP